MQISLIDVGNIEDIHRFQSDLQLILGMLECKDEMEKMRDYVNAHKVYFESIDVETYQAISELLHSEKEMKILVKQSENKESMNMCKAIEDLYNSGVDEGIKRGIYAFIEACKEIGLEKEIVFLKLQEKFSVSEEKALEYMEKYSN